MLLVWDIRVRGGDVRKNESGVVLWSELRWWCSKGGEDHNMMHRYNNAVHQEKMKKENYETLNIYGGETQWHKTGHDVVAER